MASRCMVEVASCCAIAALVIVLPQAVVAQSSSPPPPAVPWWWPSRDIIFWTSTYNKFMIYLIGTAAIDARARFDDHISVLPVQNIGPMGIWLKPPMWYMTTLMPNAPEPGNVPEHKARLAIRLDNFYIVGFTNKWGQWFATTDGARVIPNAVPLGFSGSYPSLLGSISNVRNLRLGISATNWARHVLANFDLATGNMKTLKKAFAVQIITICESARFPRIRALIVDGWLAGVNLGELEVRYLNSWRDICCAMLSFQIHHDWWRTAEAQRLAVYLQINSDTQARQEVDLALQPTTCSDVVPVYY